jgi:hypothetical protein
MFENFLFLLIWRESLFSDSEKELFQKKKEKAEEELFKTKNIELKSEAPSPFAKSVEQISEEDSRCNLLTLLEDESVRVSRRGKELRALEMGLRECLDQKRAQLASEEKALLQMSEVRAMMQEGEVVHTIYGAKITKKQQLVEVEKELLTDMEGLCSQIHVEVRDMHDKLDSLCAVCASLSVSPSSSSDSEALQAKVARYISITPQCLFFYFFLLFCFLNYCYPLLEFCENGSDDKSTICSIFYTQCAIFIY